ncbi:unnamed protein product, partial [marine sediment metagenome]
MVEGENMTTIQDIVKFMSRKSPVNYSGFDLDKKIISFKSLDKATS